jgi:hypothetical protein
MEGDLQMRILVTLLIAVPVIWCIFAGILPAWDSLANSGFSFFSIQEWVTFLIYLTVLGLLLSFLFYAYSVIGKSR